MATIHDHNSDSEEWEYEYSTTETETYYLTLDLTIPEELAKQDPEQNEEKVHERSVWLNPSLGRNKRPPMTGAPPDRPPDEFQVVVAEGDKEEKEEVSQIPQDDHSDVLGPDSSRVPEVPEIPEIQILDLHSKKPIVSFRGRIFACEWAENIGTELLFTRQKDDNRIPSLRTLPGNVDLLSASSVRLISKVLDVEPRKRNYEAESTRINPKSISIDTRFYSNEKGLQQAKFLEGLMQIKSRKGEADEVTVHSEKRPNNTDWRFERKIQRRDEKEHLKAMVDASDEEARENALRGLEELAREEKRLPLKIRAPRKRHLVDQIPQTLQRPDSEIDSGRTGRPGLLTQPDRRKRRRQRGPDGQLIFLNKEINDPGPTDTPSTSLQPPLARPRNSDEEEDLRMEFEDDEDDKQAGFGYLSGNDQDE